MLACVQVEHKIDQRPLEFRTGAGKTNESAPTQLRRALQVENLQLLSERDVIERFAGEFRLPTPLSNHLIRARVFTQGNAFVRQIRNLEQQIPLLFIGTRRALIQIDSGITKLSNLAFQFFCRFAAGFSRTDFLAQPIALGLQSLQLGLSLSPFGIDFQQLVNSRCFVTTPGRESFVNEVRFFANQTNVEHGAIVEAAIVMGNCSRRFLGDTAFNF
jgi:hypothetical protein